MPTYTFGTFQLNASSGGLGYFLIGKELPLPNVKPQTTIIARRDGAKKSGEAVDPRQISVLVKVVGTSRTDLISRIDTLQAALALRGQTLCIHEDSRYYQNVDAISAPLALRAGGGIVQAEIGIVFLAYDPYAYGPTLQTYDSGVVTLTLSGGTYNFPAIAITGGGTQYSYPLIRLYNRSTSAGQWTAISVTQTNDSQLLQAINTAGVPLPLNSGDYVDIQCDPAAQNGWTIITNNSGLLSEPIGVFPVIEPVSTTFDISITCATAVKAEAVISWLPRYMS